ncbi:hypothetical protein DFH09DRAFT_1324990 [Mycena vulgaris]|nr:hypothetical protein DFH09DRAFT_1324990 [Mycena vulgaris]
MPPNTATPALVLRAQPSRCTPIPLPSRHSPPLRSGNDEEPAQSAQPTANSPRTPPHLALAERRAPRSSLHARSCPAQRLRPPPWSTSAPGPALASSVRTQQRRLAPLLSASDYTPRATPRIAERRALALHPALGVRISHPRVLASDANHVHAWRAVEIPFKTEAEILPALHLPQLSTSNANWGRC